MRKISQILLCTFSFLALLVAGNFLSWEFRQLDSRLEYVFGGKPMPAITVFFTAHHRLPSHLVLLPWLALIGAPLLRRSGVANYWDVSAFNFRYLAFMTSELALFGVFQLAFSAPFLSLFSTLGDPALTSPELVVRIVFWLAALTVVALVIWRRNQRRETPGSGE